jgi:hypothetical protein
VARPLSPHTTHKGLSSASWFGLCVQQEQEQEQERDAWADSSSTAHLEPEEQEASTTRESLSWGVEEQEASTTRESLSWGVEEQEASTTRESLSWVSSLTPKSRRKSIMRLEQVATQAELQQRAERLNKFSDSATRQRRRCGTPRACIARCSRCVSLRGVEGWVLRRLSVQLAVSPTGSEGAAGPVELLGSVRELSQRPQQHRPGFDSPSPTSSLPPTPTSSRHRSVTPSPLGRADLSVDDLRDSPKLRRHTVGVMGLVARMSTLGTPWPELEMIAPKDSEPFDAEVKQVGAPLPSPPPIAAMGDPAGRGEKPASPGASRR